jgi:hypothetical protein
MAGADGGTAASRLFYSTDKEGLRGDVTDLRSMTAMASNDKEHEWKQPGGEERPGQQACIVVTGPADVFLIVVRWTTLVWDEIGRAGASVSADASSRACPAALRTTSIRGGLVQTCRRNLEEEQPWRRYVAS